MKIEGCPGSPPKVPVIPKAYNNCTFVEVETWNPNEHPKTCDTAYYMSDGSGFYIWNGTEWKFISTSGGGGVPQVQANWEETNPNSKAFILNKPFEELNTEQFDVVDGKLELVDTPDWLTPVETPPTVEEANRNSAYITPDNRVWALNYDGTEVISISGSGGLIDYIILEADNTKSTDITNKLNAFIQLAASLKKGVYIPEGEYLISGAVNINENVNILGSGIGQTILEIGPSGNFNIGSTKEVYGIQISELEISARAQTVPPIFKIRRLHESRVTDLKISVFDGATIDTAFELLPIGADSIYSNDFSSISIVAHSTNLIERAVRVVGNANSNHFLNFRTLNVEFPFFLSNTHNIVLSECSFENFNIAMYLSTTTGTYINGSLFETGTTGVFQENTCRSDHFVGNSKINVSTMFNLLGTYQMLDDTQTVADFLRVRSGMLADLDMRGYRLLNTSVANLKLSATAPSTPTAGTTNLFFDGSLKLQKDDGTIVNLTYPNDIPWTDFTYGTGWSGISGQTRFKVSENVLHLNMTDLRTQAAINANTNYTVATLPVNARPSSKFETLIAHRSGTNIVRTGIVTVNTDGTIVVNFTSASTATTGTAYNAIKAFYSIPLG